MNNDIAKDAAELLPCPFCGAEAQSHDGDHAVNHSDKCFLTHHYAQETWLLGKRKMKLWNTRATAAEKERIAELEAKLVALGDLAVADWNDEIVGAVDATVNEPTRYKDVLRRLFTEIPAQLAAKTQECEGLREDNKAMAEELYSENAALNHFRNEVSRLEERERTLLEQLKQEQQLNAGLSARKEGE